MDKQSEAVTEDRIREIHCEIGHIRTSIANKVGLVSELTAQEIRTMQDNVTSSVESIRETFSIRHHVSKHPWLMLHGAIALGALIGRKVVMRNPTMRTFGTLGAHAFKRNATADQEYGNTIASNLRTQYASAPTNAWQKLGNQLRAEMPTVKGLALGALAGAARDFASEKMPELSSEIHNVVDRVGSALGFSVLEKKRQQSSTQRQPTSKRWSGDIPATGNPPTTSKVTPVNTSREYDIN